MKGSRGTSEGTRAPDRRFWCSAESLFCSAVEHPCVGMIVCYLPSQDAIHFQFRGYGDTAL